MIVEDLGLMPYRHAWERQERAHEQVQASGEERLLLVEHPPVITLGRRAGQDNHLLASAQRLAELGVEVVQSDRGGDVTFHGPGQLVVYPIVKLIDHGLSVGGFVHTLEDVVATTLRQFGIETFKDPAAIGLWLGSAEQPARAKKICALGVRIRRGISMHGIALNVTTDLRYFELIVPCGLADRGVTSMAEQLAPERQPAFEQVKAALTAAFTKRFGRETGSGVA